MGDGSQLEREGNLTLGVCGKVWLDSVSAWIDGIDVGCWGGVFTKCKRGRKKGKICEKKGKKIKPVTVNSKVFIRKKEGKECSAAQAKKDTIFIPKK